MQESRQHESNEALHRTGKALLAQTRASSHQSFAVGGTVGGNSGTLLSQIPLKRFPKALTVCFKRGP